ncbi:MAG: DsrE family protein [Hyphomonadaceae bacterium]
MKMLSITALVVGLLTFASAASADEPSPFGPGTVIEAYGRVAAAPDAAPLPAGVRFKIAFDVSRAAEAGSVNSGIESAARFLNLHAAAGVPTENIQLAIVVHGAAARDLTRPADAAPENPNAGLIAALSQHGVRIYLCGQTAAHYGISAADLLPGVSMALSAMTEHALLQQEGYTLNPF